MKTDDRRAFPKIGPKGEAKLMHKTVSIAGLDAAGISAAESLVREGVHLRIVDHSRVEEEAMHRLSVFAEEDITKFAVKQAKPRLGAIDPTVDVKSFHEELGDGTVFLLKGDCIVDATNDPDLNRVILSYAAKAKIPLVIVRHSGSKATVAAQPKAALLPKLDLPHVSDAGSFGPTAKAAGSLAAACVLKLLLGQQKPALYVLDLWDGTILTKKL